MKKIFNLKNFNNFVGTPLDSRVNGVGIFYLHLILIVQENSYSIHVKTVVLALEALPSKKMWGLLPVYEFCPRKNSHCTLVCAFERGLTLTRI
jgi:hypothetical protein